MSITSEIDRIKQNIANCYTTLAAKGATIPATRNVANLADSILTIPVTPPVEVDGFVTIAGDNIMTKAGSKLTYDGENNISDLTAAQSLSGSMNSFIDTASETDKMSLEQFRDVCYRGFPIKQFDRINNKATVAGFFTDENNQKYAVAVFDHDYRSMKEWLQSGLNSGLPLYTTVDDACNSLVTSTSVTQYMINKFNATQSQAFHYANQAYLTLNRVVYRGAIPNMYELKYLIDTNHAILDELDPGGYGLSLTYLLYTRPTDDNKGAISCQEITRGTVYYRKDGGTYTTSQSVRWPKYVVPVAEIPVDANNIPLY